MNHDFIDDVHFLWIFIALEIVQSHKSADNIEYFNYINNELKRMEIFLKEIKKSLAKMKITLFKKIIHSSAANKMGKHL